MIQSFDNLKVMKQNNEIKDYNLIIMKIVGNIVEMANEKKRKFKVNMK